MSAHTMSICTNYTQKTIIETISRQRIIHVGVNLLTTMFSPIG